MAVWLGAFVLAALAVAYVLIGARRREASEPSPTNAQAVFAQRAREIQAEGLAQGASAEDVAALEQELALELLAGEEADARQPTPQWPVPRSFALLVGGLATGALAFGLYAWWGDPSAPAVLAAFERATQGDAEQQRALAAALTARAHARPKDANTWLHLAGVRMRLADYAGAATAFATAHGIVGADEQVDLAWAQAQFLADGGRVSATTRRIAERVLAKSPNHPAMRELLAMGDLRAGRFAAASEHLANLLRQDLPAERRRLLEETLALARQRQGAERAEEAEPALGASAGVAVQVSIAVPVDGETPVFVIARVVAGAGPPVAVRRLRAADLPARIVLTDADAMLPNHRLSALTEVEVLARASLSGAPTATTGDIASGAVRVRVGAEKPVPLRLENVLP